MGFNLKNKDFLKLLDFTSDEIKYLIDLSITLKQQKRLGIVNKQLEGKSIVIMFQKTSTRTRCSFEVAAYDLGMHVTYLDSSSSQFGKKESVQDTAMVLSRFYDGIEFRGFKQKDVEDLAKYSCVPVWNGLTDEWHPTQMIADMMTIKEHFGKLKGLKLVYCGDARNNIANSLMVACAKLGLHFVACAPKKLMPSPALVKQCQQIAKDTGASITLESNKLNATKNANIIYTDVWVSMGESDKEWDKRLKILKNYQVDVKTMQNANKNNSEGCIFLHCLPAYHGLDTEVGMFVSKNYGKKYPFVKNGEIEVTHDVIHSKLSLCFDQAENRMHSIKAIMLATIC